LFVIETLVDLQGWIETAPNPEDAGIVNLAIPNVKSNGIFLSFTQNTKIRGNTLQHNHHVALFNVCNGL
jgi:hypothetical protein